MLHIWRPIFHPFDWCSNSQSIKMWIAVLIYTKSLILSASCLNIRRKDMLPNHLSVLTTRNILRNWFGQNNEIISTFLFLLKNILNKITSSGLFMTFFKILHGLFCIFMNKYIVSINREINRQLSLFRKFKANIVKRNISLETK